MGQAWHCCSEVLVRTWFGGCTSKATCLAASAPHTRDWVFALPISACGLRLDAEAGRVAVALYLGLKVCVPHLCHCVKDMDAWDPRAFVCKHAPRRTQRHHALDIIARACASAGVSVSKEPSGFFPADIQRSYGLILIPWQAVGPSAAFQCHPCS